MAVFLNSTHDRCWVFTDSDITNLHARVYSINNSNPAQSSSSSSSSPSSSSSSGRVIDMDTRDFLLQHYTYKMEVALQSFKGISPCVLYSAVTYFRRFYLRRSFYEFAPRMIFATCLYLATKSEEHHVKVVHLHRACFPNTTQQTPQAYRQIPAFEVALMETLDFQLLVFSPFRALDGLLASIVDTLHASDIKSERKQLEQTAAQIGKVAVEVVLTRGVYTDLVLLFRPNQIAFAALVHAAHQLSVYDGFVGAFVDVVAADSSSSSSNGSLPPAHADAVKQLLESSGEIRERFFEPAPLVNSKSTLDVKYQQRKQAILTDIEEHCNKANLYGSKEYIASKAQHQDDLEADDANVLTADVHNTLGSSSMSSRTRKMREEDLLTGDAGGGGGLFGGAGGDDDDGEFVINRKATNSKKMDISP